MRQLEINLFDLQMAFESQDPISGLRHYLDVNTGKVLTLSEDDDALLQDLFEEFGDEATFEEMVAEADLPEEGLEALRVAYALETATADEYLEIPQIESDEAFRDMEDFIETVEDKRLRRELIDALKGRRPFARFKAVLGSSFHDRERWFKFKDERQTEHMAAWLRSEGIEPIFKVPEPVGPPSPPVRGTLLEAVRDFVKRASVLRGVKRIAILGEVITEHPSPADACVLVTVTDEMDLEPLAKAGRQLLGACSTVGRGSDVFLADVRGKYLGRTCPWKECEPGIRMACRALHCGRRHYLYDDLKNLKLEPALIQEPPVEVWPHVVKRAPVPKDLAEIVLGESAS
jgi:hypothetical protein